MQIDNAQENTVTQRIERLTRKIVLVTGVLGLSVAFWCGFINSSKCYNLLWIWPISYLIYLILTFSKIRNEHFLGISLITLTQLFPRYVIYPFVIANTSQGYHGVRQISMTDTDVSYAIIFAVIEILGLSLFLWMLERVKTKKNYAGNESNELYLSGNNVVYLIYIIAAIILYLLIGRKYNVIQFLTISSSYNDVSSNIYLTLIKYIVSIALCLIMLMVIYSQKIKYEYNGKSIHAYVALMAGMLFTMVIVGESRGTQLAIGILVCFILIQSFPQKAIPIIVFLGITIVFVIASITLFRTGTGVVETWKMNSIADKMQVYYGGPESIAQSIKLLKNRIGVDNIIFDFVRSTFPFNLVLKGTGSTVSQIYNLTLYGGAYNHGQIVFGASYGYLFADVIGVPITICLNAYLLLKACEIFTYTLSYEVKYVAGYCMIRLLAATLVNTPSILGSVTQYIGTFGLLIFVSNRLVLKK